MADRITGRLNDGTAFVHSETGNEGVGHFTTQRRLPEIICKLARLEDKIESGELVEVRHARFERGYQNGQYGIWCTNCGAGWVNSENAEWIAQEHNYCPKCGAKMDKS